MTKQTMTPEEKYAASVEVLSDLALNQGSGYARCAAQVLLSAYNGANWQLNVTDLCELDDKNMIHAMNVLMLRRSVREEPHYMIENGDEIFQKIAKRWKRYRIDNRYKRDCPDCYGSGEQEIWDDTDELIGTRTCTTCNGEKWLG
ncbi:DUF7673 family protein [Endozoicomonas sp. ALC020]|uniref:DUF7673 family protein n=1 Tax=unclassified Endozoicomonas TaxID=2644528 RepID=UPI003BB117DA